MAFIYAGNDLRSLACVARVLLPAKLPGAFTALPDAPCSFVTDSDRRF